MPTLVQGDSGPEVRAFQEALNRRAEPRFYPPLAADGEFGPATRVAYESLGWALGLRRPLLEQREIPPAVQDLIANPERRTPAHLKRARERAPKLHERIVLMDGTPLFWGLAKPLVRARERGWGGSLISGDRRKGIPERFGKKSQATLFACAEAKRKTNRCPSHCGGECNPANPPGFSSHELRSDGSAGFPGKARGAKLKWFELGLDCGDSDGLVRHLRALGYKAKLTYPNSRSERHHVNFTANPGRVLPVTGPNTSPGTRPPVPAAPPPTSRRLKGIDVSEHQPSIAWRKVAASGRVWAYARVSEGLNRPDEKFGERRWSEMRKAGLARGAYHFARPQKGRDPRDEVHEFLRLLKRAGGLQDGDLVPMVDVEGFGAAGRLTPRQTLEWVRGFVNEMHAQIGRRPIIYTGVFWRETMKNPADNLGCKLWLAAFVKKPDPFVPAAWHDEGWTIWQHSETGTVPGVEGAKCDVDVLRGGTAALDRLRM